MYNSRMATKKKKHAGGRPAEYNEKFHNPWVRSLAREGLNGKQIAAELGITERTLYNWAKRYPEFFQCLNEGRQSSDAQVEAALFRKAIGGTVKETRKVVIKDEKNGKENKHVEMVEIEREVMPDTGAAIFWLKNRQPDKWRDKREYEHTLSEQVITDELSAELEKLASEI